MSGIDILNEVERDGKDVLDTLRNSGDDEQIVIEHLSREQMILFLKYFRRQDHHLTFYKEKYLDTYSDDRLGDLVAEAVYIDKNERL